MADSTVQENDLVDTCGFDFDINDFRIEIDSDFSIESRYVKPYFNMGITEDHLTYENAQQLARDLKPEKDMRAYVIVDGTFYFGDFIEAWMVEHGIIAEEMTISTLSMNDNNVDSLRTLLEKGYVKTLNLIVSAFFYAHERGDLVKYIYEELDIDNRFQLAVARTHCKTCIFRTKISKVVIHGSANLRTSGNLEQLMIEENPELYDFNYEYQSRIIERYATIKKEVRGRKLWQLVAKKFSAKSTQLVGECQAQQGADARQPEHHADRRAN